MSLVAHYPLNGDANDMLGNYNGTTNNVTWVDGKLGQAGNFTSSSNINITTISLLSTASFCAWAYMTESASGQMIFSTDRASGGGCDLYFSGGVISWNTGDGNGNPFRNNGVNVSYPSLNTWHHYAVVNDMIRNKVVLYLNGSYYGEANWRDTIQTNRRFIIGNYNNSSSYAWRGLINDVRIYDHALSPKEIKEIAKAKILHYKFDDPYEEPTTNLIPNPTKEVTSATSEFIQFTDLAPIIEMKGLDTVYSLSFDIKSKDISNYNKIKVYLQNGSGARYSFPSPSVSVTSDYERHTVEGINFSLQNTGTSQAMLAFYGEYGTGNIPSVKNVQLEEKDHATPFTVGTRQSVIRDCSGFRNDGVISLGSPSWQQDRSIGSSSVFFDSLIRIEPPRLLGNTQEITLSAWFKSKGLSGGAHHQVFGGPEAEVSVQDGGAIRFGYHVNGVRQVSNHGSGTTDGNWHHIVSTFNKDKRELFLDGTKIASSNEVGVIKNDFYRTINTHGSSTAYWTNGNLDDIRIYATALSASDIKDLYELRGSIESNGTFWAEDLSETEAVTSGLKSSGTLEGTELIETGYSPSLIDYSTWRIGDSNAVGFGNNGSTAENGIEVNTNPWGDEDIVWAARNNDTGSNDDGGFNGSAVPIDRTKTHRFSIWIRRAVSGNGTWYFGCSASNGAVESLSGSPNTNPYFSNGSSVFENEWFLLVGYVYPTGTTTNLYDDAGIYDVQGKKLTSVASFRCGTGTTHLGLRSYLYYSTQPSTVQFFYRPRIDVMDTSAPTLRDILTGSENQPIIHQYGSSGQYENEYSKINTNGKVLASEFNEV